MGDCESPSQSLLCRPAIPHTHLFASPPFCKFLHSAQDAQSINKTLSPPLGARPQEATQEPAGLPSKAASLVAPRNANRFGNWQNRVGWLDGWMDGGRGDRGVGRGGLGSWIIETAQSCSCAGANQSKIGGQQKEMRSTPKEWRHFTPPQS